jgi:hypothetical protein
LYGLLSHHPRSDGQPGKKPSGRIKANFLTGFIVNLTGTKLGMRLLLFGSSPLNNGLDPNNSKLCQEAVPDKGPWNTRHAALFWGLF